MDRLHFQKKGTKAVTWGVTLSEGTNMNHLWGKKRYKGISFWKGTTPVIAFVPFYPESVWWFRCSASCITAGVLVSTIQLGRNSFQFSPLAVLSCTAYFSPLWSVLSSSSESLAWGWPIVLCELSLWSSTLRRWTRNSSSWAKLSVILSGLCVFCAVSLVLDPQVWKCKCWHQR